MQFPLRIVIIADLCVADDIMTLDESKMILLRGSLSKSLQFFVGGLLLSHMFPL
jgi:hypothetical protein